MQKVKLNRIGKEPVIREIPDNCTAFIDMRAKLTFQKMYDPLDKRWRTPVAQYFVFWTKNEKGEWILHNEPLEELIRMGYLVNKGFQEAIAIAKTEGINAPVAVGILNVADEKGHRMYDKDCDCTLCQKRREGTAKWEEINENKNRT